MKTLVAVMSHQEAGPIVRMNGPTWPLSGGDVMGVEHEDKPPMSWPYHAKTVQRLRMGTDYGRETNGCVGRLVRVMEWCLAHTKYEAYCFIEADVVFLRPIPLPLFYNTPVGTLAGHRSEGFRGDNYWHCPWLFNRGVLERVVVLSNRLFHAHLDEQGMPDRFMGLISDLYPDVGFSESGNYSRNTIEANDIEQAVKASKSLDCWAMHGIKTRAAFDAIML